jgi:hypothetical protein
VALVLDNENGLLTGYLDGVSSGTDGTANGWNCDGRGGASTVSFTPGSVIDTATALVLGARADGLSGFNGQLDDFAVWSRVLSDQEIVDLSTGAEIPEPSTMTLLLLLGALGPAVRRQRRGCCR